MNRLTVRIRSAWPHVRGHHIPHFWRNRNVATAKETAAQPTESKGLARAVKTEVNQAANAASTGNVATAKESSAQPAESLGVNDKIARSRR